MLPNCRPHRKKLLILCLNAIMVAVVGVGIWAVANAVYFKASRPETINSINTPKHMDNGTSKRVNLLLLGLDDGDFDNPNSPRRSDTIIVASIDPVAKTVNLLSIPRDSRVVIPGQPNYDKIAHAFFYGGPELAVRTVESFLNVPIDHYVAIDWQAFIKTVDILGGVNVNVQHAMNYDDPYENLSIHLEKGYQHLNGKKAGEYVRFRHDELGDIGRVQRQELFLHALVSQMLQTGTVFKLPALVATLNHFVRTDMDVYTMVKLAEILKDIKSEGIRTAMIPGDFATIDDLSYWMPDIVSTRKIVDNMLAASPTAPPSSEAQGV